jgi:3-methyladenine DNA glycosylase AlkD
MTSTRTLIETMIKLGDPKRAQGVARFFKSGKGEYGEGDYFLGIRVPAITKVAKNNINISLDDVGVLLKNKWHEIRVLAVKILALKFGSKKTSDNEKNQIYKFYLKNTKNINNWDLVDISCHYVVGSYLLNRKTEAKSVLSKLAKSKNLWEKRIAIISTYAFIRNNDLELTYDIADMLLEDEHDLTHKAVGWMLREAGKRDEFKLKEYLTKNIAKIPRTSLRYAIERFPKSERKRFLLMR